jgi:hypothetical protein
MSAPKFMLPRWKRSGLTGKITSYGLRGLMVRHRLRRRRHRSRSNWNSMTPRTTNCYRYCWN